MTTTSDRDILEGALGALGTSHQEVADTLMVLGIKGTHGARSCPIANYLSAQPLAHQGYVASCSEFSVVLDIEGSEYDLRHPGAVRDFIRKFDSNKYPDLEA